MNTGTTTATVNPQAAQNVALTVFGLIAKVTHFAEGLAGGQPENLHAQVHAGPQTLAADLTVQLLTGAGQHVDPYLTLIERVGVAVGEAELLGSGSFSFRVGAAGKVAQVKGTIQRKH